MLTLALETATEIGGVALGRDEWLVAESVFSVRAAHSEEVLPEVSRLLDRADLEPGALDAIVVGAGPGSFTGVRIAAALGKGLCFAAERPLYAYSSLAAVAAGTGRGERVCAVFPAREREVFAAAYAGLRPLEPLFGPEVLEVDELLDRLPAPEGWLFAGQGALHHAATLREDGRAVAPAHLSVPRPSSLLWLAREEPERGRVASPDTWEPAYTRPPAARPPAGWPA